jgi:predicted RNA-binding Zn ribbon-like protein
MADKPWKFHLSGRASVDLANTVSWRASGQPVERLARVEDVIRWARQSGLIGDREASELTRQAGANPARAALAVARIRGLREAIYRVFSMLADGRRPAAADLAPINRVLSHAMRHLHVTARADRRFVLAWKPGDTSLGQLLWPVARSVAEILTSEHRGRLKKCPSASCGWIFVDTTRNGTRRWCDMRVCGNRAKARRHYHRRRRSARRRVRE